MLLGTATEVPEAAAAPAGPGLFVLLRLARNVFVYPFGGFLAAGLGKGTRIGGQPGELQEYSRNLDLQNGQNNGPYLHPPMYLY